MTNHQWSSLTPPNGLKLLARCSICGATTSCVLVLRRRLMDSTNYGVSTTSSIKEEVWVRISLPFDGSFVPLFLTQVWHLHNTKLIHVSHNVSMTSLRRRPSGSMRKITFECPALPTTTLRSIFHSTLGKDMISWRRNSLRKN